MDNEPIVTETPVSEVIPTDEPIKDDCVGEHMAEIQSAHPDMSQDQQVAIALSKCGEGNKSEITPPEANKAESVTITPPVEFSEPTTTADIAVKTYFGAGALKTLGQGKIGGYLVAYGSPTQRDSHDEWFTPQTDYYLEYYPERPVLYHHGLTNDAEATKIGRIYKITPDGHGLYAEAELFVDHEDPEVRKHAQFAYQMVSKGKLGWSSGSVPHLVDVTPDGQITKWPIVEGSLTPTPAEPKRTSVQALKSAISALETTEPEEPKELPAKGDEPAPVVENALSTQPKIKSITRKKKMQTAVKSSAADIIAAAESAKLSPEQTLALLKALPDTAPEPDGDEAVMADGATEPPTEATAPDSAYMAKFDKLTPHQRAMLVEEYMRTAPANRQLPAVETETAAVKANQDIQVFSPYEKLSAEDMSYLIHMRQMYAPRLNQGFYQPDVKMVREIAAKAQKAIKSGEIDFGSVEKDQNGLTLNQRILGIKGNELDNTGVAAAAGNWVPELWSNQLWNRIRLANRVAGQFQVTEMPSQTYDLPVEDADPTVYFVPETTNDAQLSLASGAAIPDSLVSAGKVQLVAKKLALRVGFSTEMMEDSIIQFIPQLRSQAMWAMENAVDNVLINGDTTNSSANINGTPGAATDKFLAFNGMRYLSLITNAAANAIPVNAGGASPTLQMIRQARFTLISSLNVYATDPTQLFIVVDPYTYGKMLNIDELLAFYNNGRDSTVNTGVVPNVDGITVFPSSQVPLTAATGKVGASGNDFGTLIIGAKNAWKVGYRRQITASLDFLSYYDSYQLTMTIRLAFKNKDNIANSLIYNLATS